MSLGHGASVVKDGLVLHLDAANVKSYPGKTGPELVTNSTIASIDGNTFNVIRNATQNISLSLCSVVSGKYYIVTYNISSYSGSVGATFRVNGGGANLTPGIGISTSGTFTRTFQATVSGTLSINGDNTGTDLEVDFVSVKEMLDNTGTTWHEISGIGTNGTLLNGIGYVSGNESSLIFDGANDSVEITHNSTFNFNSNFTVSTWVNVNSFSTSAIYNVVSKKPSFNNTQKGWSCQYDYRTTGVLQFRNNDGSVLNDQTPTSNVNNVALLNQTENWVNSVWAVTSSNVTFYINSIQKGTLNINFSDTDTTTPIYIGKTIGSTGDPSMAMNLSSVMIYNKTLSSEEILQNFEALRGRYGI
jgi:hypothetical protein